MNIDQAPGTTVDLPSPRPQIKVADTLAFAFPSSTAVNRKLPPGGGDANVIIDCTEVPDGIAIVGLEIGAYSGVPSSCPYRIPIVQMPAVFAV
jgi:hypothetical protein